MGDISKHSDAMIKLGGKYKELYIGMHGYFQM